MKFRSLLPAVGTAGLLLIGGATVAAASTEEPMIIDAEVYYGCDVPGFGFEIDNTGTEPLVVAIDGEFLDGFLGAGEFYLEFITDPTEIFVAHYPEEGEPTILYLETLVPEPCGDEPTPTPEPSVTAEPAVEETDSEVADAGAAAPVVAAPTFTG